MFEKFFDFFLKPGEKDGKNKKQNLLMYLSFLLMLGILLILISNIKVPKQVANIPANGDEAIMTFQEKSNKEGNYEAELERQIEQILSLIEGAGRVKVKITFQRGMEYVYGYNTSYSENFTEEKDNSGGVRSIKDMSRQEDLVIIRGKDGEERVVVKTELYPEVKGVLIVADGANDSRISAELARAVNTVLGVDLHKICVLPYKR